MHCPIDPSLFGSVGSCSDEFYGAPKGSFDYPLTIFYLLRTLPEWININPNIIAFSMGSVLIFALYAIINSLTQGILRVAILFVVLFSHSFRYLLERGQMDQLAWFLALVPLLLLTQRTKDPCNLFTLDTRIILGTLSLAASVLLKAFTLPILFLWPIILIRETSLKKRRFSILLSVFIVIITTLVLFLQGISPGAHSSSVQLMPGEIFGFKVGLSPNHNDLTLFEHAGIKVGFVLVGLISSREIFTSSLKSLLNSFNTLYIFTLGSTTFLAFYFFTASANYKLVSAQFLLISIITSFKSSSATKTLTLDRLIVYTIAVSVFCLTWHNYLPYIPSLQFIMIDYINLCITPFLVGFSLYPLLQFPWRQSITLKT